MKNKMRIATACNNSFCQHLGVLLYSIGKNKKCDTEIDRFFVLNDDLSDKNKHRLTAIADKFSINMIFVHVDNSKYYKYKIDYGVPHHSTYYRISIAELIGNDVDKLLYLDSDIVVTADISDLWDTDVEKHTLAAVPDEIGEERQKVYSAKRNEYFNSGVMLINLKRWRQNNVTAKIIAFLESYTGELLFREQDALNAILHSDFVPLSAKFNFMSHLFSNTSRLPDFKPSIIHYTGDKPWRLFNNQKRKFTYYKYLWRTPWRFYIPDDLTYENIMHWYLKDRESLRSILKGIKRALKISSRL